MNLPILNLIKSAGYREIARFQDTAVALLYQIDSAIVLHGGTAVWRCFGGSRFSNDIDAYSTSKMGIEAIKDGISTTANAYGIRIEKIKDTGNLLFMGLSSGETYLKLEINHAKGRLNPTLRKFENVDGTFRDVLTLKPDDLIIEKIAAYSDRRFARDIYDLYILCDYVTDKNRIKKKVKEFLASMEKPINEPGLEALVYSGPTPGLSNMTSHIASVFS